MFDWFSRRKRQPANQQAYERGRRAGQQFSDDLDQLLETRFKPVFDGYLSVMQKQLNRCLAPVDGPPLTVARIEHKIFLENVDELANRMRGEITAALSAWLDVADQLESRDMFLKLIQAKVDDFCQRLGHAGF
jgi:hypothetical protein